MEQEEKNMQSTVGTSISDDIAARFSDAESHKKKVISDGFTWDAREEMFYGVYHTGTKKGSGEIDRASMQASTGELQSLVYDAACREMAQMPTGRFINIKDGDITKAIAANLVYHDYIIPHAKTGGDFFVKSRQANIYSKIYGKSIVLVDFIAGDTEDDYTGPDAILIHPRRFYPQPGKYSINDMDWCFIDMPVTKEWLTRKAKESPDIWNPKVIADITENTPDNTTLSVEEQKNIAQTKTVTLRHYYTREGDWTLYTTDGKILIDEKKRWPCIPIVEKGTIPLLDRYWDYSEYERGEMPQKTIDSLLRAYLQIVQRGIEPIAVIDPMMMVMSSINYENKFWFAKDGHVDKVRFLETDGNALQTFQPTYNTLKAMLMSQSASTDTSVAKGVDVGFGRTPQALRMQQEREGARDSWGRYMQEKFLENLAMMMMRVASHCGMDKVHIPNIRKALEHIGAVYETQDLDQFVNSNGIISDDLLKDFALRYEVDPGSTLKHSNAGQELMNMLVSISGNQYIMESLKSSGKTINWGEAVKRAAIEKGIQDWDRIIIDEENPQSVEGVEDASAMEQEPEQPTMPLMQENNPLASLMPQSQQL